MSEEIRDGAEALQFLKANHKMSSPLNITITSMEAFLNKDLNISDIELNSSAISPIKDEIQSAIQKIHDTIEQTSHKSMLEERPAERELLNEPTLKQEIESLREIVMEQGKEIENLKNQLNAEGIRKNILQESQNQKKEKLSDINGKINILEKQRKSMEEELDAFRRNCMSYAETCNEIKRSMANHERSSVDYRDRIIALEEAAEFYSNKQENGGMPSISNSSPVSNACKKDLELLIIGSSMVKFIDSAKIEKRSPTN